MSMKAFRAPRTPREAAIPVETALDERLSYAARGLLLDMLSRPDGWEANADELSQAARRARGEFLGEGRRAMRALFAELEAAGYIRRTRKRLSNGAFFTHLDVCDTPNGWDDSIAPESAAPFPERGQADVVYVVGGPADGVVKIGTTSNLSARLRQLQTSSPYELCVLWSFGGDWRLESHLHQHFAEKQLKGEWFNFGDDDPMVAVQSCAEAYYGVPPGACASWS